MNQSEASKFDYGIAGWWESGGAAQPLQALNALRVPLVKNSLLGTPPDDITTLDHTPYPLRGYHVLDAGCGAGLLCEVRSDFNPNIQIYYVYPASFPGSPPQLLSHSVQ